MNTFAGAPCDANFLLMHDFPLLRITVCAAVMTGLDRDAEDAAGVRFRTVAVAKN